MKITRPPESSSMVSSNTVAGMFKSVSFCELIVVVTVYATTYNIEVVLVIVTLTYYERFTRLTVKTIHYHSYYNRV